MSKLLEEFIRLTMAETPLARVPTQLLPPEGNKENKRDEEEENEEEVSEFSGVGAIAGYTLPLGMQPCVMRDKKKRHRSR